MKFLAMHITNKKYIFICLQYVHLQNIFIEHDFYVIS